MKNSVSIALMLLLAGCASYVVPIVDMAGKDPVKANQDQFECSKRDISNMPFMGPDGERAHYYERCLEERGYTVMGRERR